MSSYACPEGRPLSGRLRDAPFDYSNDHCSGAFVEPGGAHIQRRSCVMADRTLLTVHPLQRIYIYASTQVIKHRTASAWFGVGLPIFIFIIIFVFSLIQLSGCFSRVSTLVRVFRFRVPDPVCSLHIEHRHRSHTTAPLSFL